MVTWFISQELKVEDFRDPPVPLKKSRYFALGSEHRTPSKIILTPGSGVWKFLLYPRTDDPSHHLIFDPTAKRRQQHFGAGLHEVAAYYRALVKKAN
jgi:hypothetical protein